MEQRVIFCYFIIEGTTEKVLIAICTATEVNLHENKLEFHSTKMYLWTNKKTFFEILSFLS